MSAKKWLKTPLQIATPEGTNQPFHPSVKFFTNGFNGYRYWMAYSPYPLNTPPYTDRYEYPCIAGSNDGVRWSYLGTKNRPIDDLTDSQIKRRSYFSDPTLCFDDTNGKLRCYYRLTECGEGEDVDYMYMRETEDGENWCDRVPVCLSKCIRELRPLSQAIIKNDGKYYIWFVSKKTYPNYVYTGSSEDGINWRTVKRCRLCENGDSIPWHIDVELINDEYVLLVYDLKNRISLWKSADGVEFYFEKRMLSVPANGLGCFFSNSLYRSCMIKDDDGFKIYFSATDGKQSKIGLMQGDSIQSIHIVSLDKSKRYRQFFSDLFRKYTFWERIFVHLMVERIAKRGSKSK